MAWPWRARRPNTGIGLLGASLLSAMVLPLATTYAVSEGFGWERGVSVTRRMRRALRLYSANRHQRADRAHPGHAVVHHHVDDAGYARTAAPDDGADAQTGEYHRLMGSLTNRRCISSR